MGGFLLAFTTGHLNKRTPRTGRTSLPKLYPLLHFTLRQKTLTYSSPSTSTLNNLDILPSTSSTEVQETAGPLKRRTKGIVDLTSVDVDGKGGFRKDRRRVFRVAQIEVVGKVRMIMRGIRTEEKE